MHIIFPTILKYDTIWYYANIESDIRGSFQNFFFFRLNIPYFLTNKKVSLAGIDNLRRASCPNF